MFNIRSYPFVRFRRFISSTRLLLILLTISLSAVLILLYLYSHKHYQEEHLPKLQVILPNGTKVYLNEKSSNDEKNLDWQEKIKEKFKDSAHFGFIHAFIASISVIIVSELGDKTFFIAAIMAMRHSRLIIYCGAMGALGAMTILSALLGNVVTKFVPRIYTYYLSSILFACFGIKMLRDGYLMSPDEGTEEYEEAEHEIEKAETVDDLESGGANSSAGSSTQQKNSRNTLSKLTRILRRYVSPIFIQAFIMTFLAEWGDRSQITTIVLAASEHLLGVIVGGTIGHGLCTGLAVLGGRFVAQRISPKTVTLIGGIVFICFAFSAFFIRPDS